MIAVRNPDAEPMGNAILGPRDDQAVSGRDERNGGMKIWKQQSQVIGAGKIDLCSATGEASKS